MADDASTFATDYLGRSQPLSQQTLSLPSSGGGAVTGPVSGQGGTGGVSVGGGQAAPASVGGAQAGGGSAGLALALNLLRLGNTGFNFASGLFPGGPPALTGSEVSAQGGQGGVAGGVDASVNEGLGASAAEGGSELAAAEGLMSLSDVAPITAAMSAIVQGFAGQYPYEGLLNSIFGQENPSKAYATFPQRLGDTLRTEDTASMALAQALLGANSPQAVQDAIAAWRGSIGDVVGGFGAGAGPFDISGLPGAGGTSIPKDLGTHRAGHEGGISADFGPTTAGLQAMVQAALGGKTPQERAQAFLSGAQPLIDARRAQDAAVQHFIDTGEWIPVGGSAGDQARAEAAVPWSEAGGGGSA